MMSGFDRQFDVEPPVFLQLLLVDFLEGNVVFDDHVFVDHQVQVVGLAEFREPLVQQLLEEGAEVAGQDVFGDVDPEVDLLGADVVLQLETDGQEPRVVAPNHLVLQKSLLKGMALLVVSIVLLQDPQQRRVYVALFVHFPNCYKSIAMGVIISPKQKIETQVVEDEQNSVLEDKRMEKDYDIEVIDVSNIALAIKNKQHTINVELSLRCQSLPSLKAFGSIDSMIVILKNSDRQITGSSTQSKNLVEIGRTEIIPNETNPKYIKTFIYPFNEEGNNEDIEFRVYHVLKPDQEDLSHQKLVGRAKTILEALYESENNELEIEQLEKPKSKALLKINCVEYDGGNSRYEIGIELSNLVTRTSEVYYAIEAWKFGEWIPVAKSEVKKPCRFREMQVPFNKFQGEDNSGVRIKIYDAEKEEQIGTTNEFSINDILSEQRTQPYRAYHSGIVVGIVVIYKWKKIIRDSFISYIVGGARLHLILAIDFTNSNSHNSQGNSFHDLDINGQNTYINAIRQIVGVLQYFSLQNEVALYGFGAKLPPYYKSVSQCFALNGNYFNPNVEGGVEEIIRYYKQALKKIKMHGPTKISEIIDLAIKYASEQESMSSKSLTYYVLLIMTDGKINDYEDTIELIIRASSLPLSILFIGVGDAKSSQRSSFAMLESLDSDVCRLRSSRSDKVCERDIVDFIKINEILHGGSKLTLARETFAEIPNQFIDYMSRKLIKPSKEKKNLKAAKAEFISEKIKAASQKTKPFVSSFLEKEKKEMKRKLIALGYSSTDPLLDKINIATNDLSYFIEVHSQDKNVKSEETLEWTENIDLCEIKKLEKFLEMKEQDNRTKTLEKLERIESNQYGRRLKLIRKNEERVEKHQKYLEHPCLSCGDNEINLLHMECGHSSICDKCYSKRCLLCKHTNRKIKKLKFVRDSTGKYPVADSSTDSDNLSD